MNASRLRSILTCPPAIATTEIYVEHPPGTFHRIKSYRTHTEPPQPGEPFHTQIILELEPIDEAQTA